MEQLTFAEFVKLANRRHWTPESLAKRFRGLIEEPSEFFHRAFQPKNAANVIPYRSVIVFHRDALTAKPFTPKHKVCACGCGLEVFDRKKWARPGCRQRVARGAVSDVKKGDRQVHDFVDGRL